MVCDRHYSLAMNSGTLVPSTIHLSDVELLERWARGDRRAGDIVFRRLQPHLRTFFASKAGVDAVEDLVQQVWVALAETLSRGERPQLRLSVRCYLLGIARHVLFRWLRERYRSEPFDPMSSTIARLEPSLSQVVGDRLAAQKMIRALQRLPLETQVLLEFRYVHEMKVPELAVLYELPEGTIKSRLARARAHLEQTLAELESAP